MSGDLRDELDAIRRSHGYLDPEVVVNDARDEAHPLHNRFEWDNTVAGELYRREQAHRLIQSVRVRYADDERPRDLRAFIAVPRADSPRPVYEPIEEVVTDEFKRKLVLSQMEREWKTLLARYQSFAEFAEIVRRDVVGVA